MSEPCLSIRIQGRNPPQLQTEKGGEWRETTWEIAEAIFTMNFPLARALIEREEGKA